jgi:hypothetical protein
LRGIVGGLYGQRIADQPGYHAGGPGLNVFTAKYAKDAKAGLHPQGDLRGRRHGIDERFALLLRVLRVLGG